VLEDEGNRLYHRFLDIAGMAPRDKRIRLPLALTPAIAKRIERTESQWASLIVEISGHHIDARLVAGKPAENEPKATKAFVGRDFGYVNTVSLSVAVSDTLVDIDVFRGEIAKMEAKELVRQFIESHALPTDVKIVERIRFEGRHFLERVAVHADRIDRLKSEIDQSYLELDALKLTLISEMGLSPEDRLTPAMKKPHPAVRQFFIRLARINEMKQVRRNLQSISQDCSAEKGVVRFALKC
jgi:hypothetical protein